MPPLRDAMYDFDIHAINLFSLANDVHVLRDADETSPVSAIARVGYLANSPEAPTIAVSFRTLELFRTLRIFKASFSIEAFTKVICHHYKTPYRRRYRQIISDTFDIYLNILHNIDHEVDKVLGHDTADYRVQHSCPPCRYEVCVS